MISNNEDIYRTDLRIKAELARMNGQDTQYKQKTAKAWTISEVDRPRVTDFISKMKINGISDVQILKYLQSLKWFSHICQKTFEKVTKADLEAFLNSMADKSMKTRKIRYYSLKKFFDHIGMGNIFKDYGIKFNGSRKTKLPEDMLTAEEIERMINACNQMSNDNFIVMRNQALIGVLYESGARIGEFLCMRIKDIEFRENLGHLRLSGKTGDRVIPGTINYTNLLQNYLSIHPEKDNPEAFVWIKPGNKQRLGHRGVDVILKEIVKTTGIKKKMHAHLMRHTRATHLSPYMTEQELKLFMGWSAASEMAAIYVHLSHENLTNKILKSVGIETNGHVSPIMTPKFCPQCNTSNSSLQQFCKSCGSTLDKTEAMRNEKLQNVVIKYLSATGDKVLFSRLMKEEGLE